ncbi:MAG: mannose-1-phosphate guanylyltransferase/mannose-6-phosphate isomerase, partial [Gammaproteobacteria bacterium]|nr:mannose-1-phosphate guanylyltransferase/mannose-6-phosphate isomerase [Gammaproteobacteria bacterium]
RSLYPKQFHRLGGEESLLQATARRFSGAEGIREPLVICNEEHRFVVAEQLREAGISPAGIYLEPVPRNTAPAVAIAALALEKKYSQACLLVMPADHRIADPARFLAGIRVAGEAVDSGHLVTFGIQPTSPHTGYGYIRTGSPLSAGSFTAAEFVEKPDAETAAGYLKSGDYLWNSGMFLMAASDFIDQLQRYAPQILAACRDALDKAEQDLDFVRIDEQAFSACPSDSIDYAVMERSERVAVVPVDAGWSDIGSWAAVWDASQRDDAGNQLHGDVVVHECHDNLLISEDRMIAALGVSGLVVVDTGDVVLVAEKGASEDVKQLVDRLKAEGRDEVHAHRRVYRPWGAYQGVDRGDRFQVKRLIVKPGAKLSLQLHHKRSEHWVVVRGKARVTRGEEVFTLSEDESTYIPVETRHSLENPGPETLEIIEVQTGSYLGEDDIERFADRYGRC